MRRLAKSIRLALDRSIKQPLPSVPILAMYPIDLYVRPDKGFRLIEYRHHHEVIIMPGLFVSHK